MEHTNCSTSTFCWLPRVFPDSADQRLICQGTTRSLSKRLSQQYRIQDLKSKRPDESLPFGPTSCWSSRSYTSNDVYCQGSVINVPFSWEYKPGLSKVTHHHHDHDLSKNITKDGIAGKLVLQPPPCYFSSFGTRSGDVGQFCAIKPSLRRMSSFRMEDTYKEEDPFVEAYKKCTKSPFMILQRSNSNNNKGQKSNNGSWPNMRKYMHIFSCKYAGNVSIDNSVCSYKDVKGVEK